MAILNLPGAIDGGKWWWETSTRAWPVLLVIAGVVLLTIDLWLPWTQRTFARGTPQQPGDATLGRHCTLLAHEIDTLLIDMSLGKRGSQATIDLYERDLAPKVYRVVRQLRERGHVTDSGDDLNFPRDLADLEQVSKKLKALGLRVQGPVNPPAKSPQGRTVEAPEALETPRPTEEVLAPVLEHLDRVWEEDLPELMKVVEAAATPLAERLTALLRRGERIREQFSAAGYRLGATAEAAMDECEEALDWAKLVERELRKNAPDWLSEFQSAGYVIPPEPEPDDITIAEIEAMLDARTLLLGRIIRSLKAGGKPEKPRPKFDAELQALYSRGQSISDSYTRGRGLPSIDEAQRTEHYRWTRDVAAALHLRDEVWLREFRDARGHERQMAVLAAILEIEQS